MRAVPASKKQALSRAPGSDPGRIPSGTAGAHAHVRAKDAPGRPRPDRSGLAPSRSHGPACFRGPVRQCRPPPRRGYQRPGLDRGRHLHRGAFGGDGFAGFLLARDPRPGRMPGRGVRGPPFSRMRGRLAGCRGQVGRVLEMPDMQVVLQLPDERGVGLLLVPGLRGFRGAGGGSPLRRGPDSAGLGGGLSPGGRLTAGHGTLPLGCRRDKPPEDSR